MGCWNKHISYQHSAGRLTETPFSLPSIQEITRHMSEAVEGLARAIPSDMEQEKAMLVLAMVLTKKVANTMPSLLHRVFNTTVNYISQQFHNYIARMVSAGNGSPCVLRGGMLEGIMSQLLFAPLTAVDEQKGREKRCDCSSPPCHFFRSYALQTQVTHACREGKPDHKHGGCISQMSWA